MAKVITKEEFMDNTTEIELFGVIHEAIMRLRELRKEDNPGNLDKNIIVLDKEIVIITEQMITNIKSQMWVK